MWFASLVSDRVIMMESDDIAANITADKLAKAPDTSRICRFMATG